MTGETFTCASKWKISTWSRDVKRAEKLTQIFLSQNKVFFIDFTDFFSSRSIFCDEKKNDCEPNEKCYNNATEIVLH